jgi:hypothetical protein
MMRDGLGIDQEEPGNRNLCSGLSFPQLAEKPSFKLSKISLLKPSKQSVKGLTGQVLQQNVIGHDIDPDILMMKELPIKRAPHYTEKAIV